MEFKVPKPKRQPLSSELDDNYVLIYKDADNILDDIDFVVDDDRILCKTIIDSLEKEINSLKEELTSEEVMNNYKKYNEITDSIEEKEMELMEIMEKWEQLQA